MKKLIIMEENKTNLPAEAIKACDYINTLCVNYESRIAALKSENEFFNNFTPGEKLLEYSIDGNPDKVYWSNFEKKHLETGWGSDNKPDFIKRGWTIEKCQQLLKEGEEISLKNKEIIARNQERFEKIYTFLKRLGLPETKKVVDTKSRARYTKYNTVSTGWLECLQDLFPRYNRWDSLKASLNKAIEHIKRYENDKRIHLKQLEDAKNRELKEKSKIVLLGELNVKYKLGIATEDVCNYSVMDGLLQQNKYLYLAHFLAKNRGDWSEGHNYADIGLNYFNSKMLVESEGINDAAIADDIQGCITNWDGDGRVFRDTKYNYDYLFAIVKEQNLELYNDYNKLKELIGE